MTGGEAAHGGERFDVLEAMKFGSALDLLIVGGVQYGVSFFVHLQGVDDVGEVGLEKHRRHNP